MSEGSFNIKNLDKYKDALKYASTHFPSVMQNILESLGEVLLGEAKEVLRSENRPHARYKMLSRTVTRGPNVGQKRNYLEFIGTESTNSIDTGLLWNSLSRGGAGNVWTFNGSSKTFTLTVGSAVKYSRFVNDGYTTNRTRWVPGVVDGRGIFRYQRGARTGILVHARTHEGIHYFDIGFKELERIAPAIIKNELQRFLEVLNAT